jgi:hypothetical protein
MKVPIVVASVVPHQLPVKFSLRFCAPLANEPAQTFQLELPKI